MFCCVFYGMANPNSSCAVAHGAGPVPNALLRVITLHAANVSLLADHVRPVNVTAVQAS